MTEEQEHVQVAFYLNHVKALWFHSPNGGSRNVIEAAKLKRMGVKSGVPDFIVLSHGGQMAIELKREKRKGEERPRVSKNQKAWLDALEKEGWRVAVCFGAHEAITQLKEWGVE